MVFTLRGGSIPDAAPVSSFSRSDEPDLLDFLSPGASEASNVWDSPVRPGPNAKVQSAAFAPFATPTAAIPSNFSDPFAGDPDPFGPGTSSIDDLLSTPIHAASPLGDFFSGAMETPTPAPIPPVATQQRKVLVDPMDAFSFPPQPSSFNLPSTSDPMNSMNGGYNSFQGLGPTNGQQQQAFQPFQPIYGTSPPMESMPGIMDQFPYHQPQHHLQHQQPYNNAGISNAPNSYSANSPLSNGALGAPYMQSPPPLPPSLPPIAPQFDQRQHNPFDAF